MKGTDFALCKYTQFESLESLADTICLNLMGFTDFFYK